MLKWQSLSQTDSNLLMKTAGLKIANFVKLNMVKELVWYGKKVEEVQD